MKANQNKMSIHVAKSKTEENSCLRVKWNTLELYRCKNQWESEQVDKSTSQKFFHVSSI